MGLNTYIPLLMVLSVAILAFLDLPLSQESVLIYGKNIFK